ncbi:hypothetical protein [Xylanibacter ruminicola]|uniref:Uncharacterized protein n=1 Tax=Xylanibacter ruminicola TaxID=839 RepID=A0A1M6Z8Q6_XYLRU|nr:hypothetical protein [Xylanibacter ruminicola]SHL26793.1 hypothetical protein SAMN05216463_1444 [Xylanibacter ruminicola]
MRNDKEEVQYIWHDGVRICEDQLISMAKSAGSYALAEHYVCSLLAHGTIYGLAYIIDKVNEIREHYQVGAIPKPNMDEDHMSMPKSENAMVRKRYMMMELEERQQVIKTSLKELIENHQDLFRSKNDWIGIYLVIRDRVNGNLSMADFYNNAHQIMPKCWPERLMIGRYTMGNYSRCVDYEDRQEAYYDMERNPWKALCSIYWEILKQHILTNE